MMLIDSVRLSPDPVGMPISRLHKAAACNVRRAVPRDYRSVTIDFLRSGITDQANLHVHSRLLHEGQAPKGLLNENSLGSISGRLMLQSGQASLAERKSGPPEPYHQVT